MSKPVIAGASVLLTCLLLLSLPCPSYGQKKEISQAKTYIKSGKDYDKAEELMTGLLEKDSANRANEKVWLTLYTALQKQYESGNEKLYLKEKYDTATLFTLTKKIYTALEALDSVDMMPDEKGRVAPRYREKHAKDLDVLRPNLYNGGRYYFNKGDYSSAFPYFGMYIDSPAQPIFTGYDYGTDDAEKITSAAYWATVCGARLKDADMTLRYSETALRDTTRMKYTLMHIAEAYKLKDDEQMYAKTLRKGFDISPDFPYFFATLMDYYNDSQKVDSALSLSERALQIDGRNRLFLLARSAVLYNAGMNEECIAISDSLISITDSIAEPYFNAGMAYLNIILEKENMPAEKKDRNEIRRMYATAKPYMERYRALAPDEKDKWGFPLYRIYLNLNDGTKFDEIDKILKK